VITWGQRVQAQSLGRLGTVKRKRQNVGREDLPASDVAFACQECGKQVAFPADRGGHVEICPHCGEYVDVPYMGQTLLPGESEPAQPPAAPTAVGLPKGSVDSRPTWQLWIEVPAVLCLAYFPYLWGAFDGLGRPLPTDHYAAVSTLYRVMSDLRVAMPLLVIMALSREPWARFGIVRLCWGVDLVGGCVVWLGATWAHRIVSSLMTPAMVEGNGWHRLAHHATDQGGFACALLVVACLVGPFSEELVMRGYLIPRLERLLGSTCAAILLTAVLFGSYHLYQGVGPAISTAAMGLVYGASFCVLRRLWPICLAHTLGNILFAM
jgi:membrane protease YdiL (CAAX protease family)